MSNGDARISAWLNGWDLLQAAGRMRVKFREQVSDYEKPLPPDYYAMVAEGQAYATLANAETSTGWIAAGVIADKEESEHAESDAFLAEARDRKKDGDEDPA